MHALHIIAVEAETQEEAVSAAEAFLEPYQDIAWDWYSVGGRWAGYLNGSDTMCAENDPVAFRQALVDASEIRLNEWNETRQKLLGMAISPSEVSGPFSHMVTDRAAAAQQISENNKEIGDAFMQALASETPPRDNNFFLAYTVRKFSDLLDGNYTFNSGFYDAINHSATPDDLYQRLDGKQDLGSLWLVAMDLHN